MMYFKTRYRITTDPKNELTEQEQQERNLSLNRRDVEIAGSGDTIEHCLTCRKKMTYETTLWLDVECTDGRTRQIKIKAPRPGIQASGLFCSNKCAIEFALCAASRYRDPHPPACEVIIPVKAKKGTFVRQEYFGDRQTVQMQPTVWNTNDWKSSYVSTEEIKISVRSKKRLAKLGFPTAYLP